MGAWKQEPQSLLPTAEPTREDLLFFAGFYEGEGCACPGKGKGKGGCIVQVPQRDPEMLYKGRSFWGGSVRKINGRECWAWVMSGDRARLFLQAIYPFLSARRKVQIENANAFTLSGIRGLDVGGIDADRAIARAQMTESQKHSETVTRWARSHKEKVNEIAARCRDKNREKINARQRARRREMREQKLESSNYIQ